MKGEKLVKITTNVFEEDWEALKRYFPNAGPSKALRSILRKHIKGLQAQVHGEVKIKITPGELEEVLHDD